MDRLVAYCRSDRRRVRVGDGSSSSLESVGRPGDRPGAGRHDRAALVRTLLAWRIAAMMGRISQEVVVALRGALHRKLMRLPMAYFDAQQTGRLMARVTSDVGSILMFIRSGILQLLNDLILSVAIAVLLGWLQWRLALVALVAVPLYALNQRAFFGTLRRLSDEIRAQVAALYALLSERVSAVRVVRSFAKEDDELVELDERIDRHRALSWDNTRAAAALGALATLISGLGTVFVIAYGIVLVGRGLLDRRRAAGDLRPGGPALSADRPADAVPGDGPGDPGLGRAALRDLRRARAGARPPGRRRRSSGRAGRSSIAASRSRIRRTAPRCSTASTCGSSRGCASASLGPSGAGKSTLLALAPRLYDIPEGTDSTGQALGRGLLRRPRRPRPQAGRPAPGRGPGAAAGPPVRGHDPHQPALRQPGGDRGPDVGGPS